MNKFFYVLDADGFILRYGRCPVIDVEGQKGADGFAVISFGEQQPNTDADSKWDFASLSFIPL